MVKVLAEEAVRLAIPFHNHTTAIKILSEGEGEHRRIVGLLAMRAADRSAENPFGIALFQCASVVLAAGGPGELYRDSVYPNGCFGSLGLALEAGIEAVNLMRTAKALSQR